MLNYSDIEAQWIGLRSQFFQTVGEVVGVFFLSEEIVREQSSQETLKLWLHAALTCSMKINYICLSCFEFDIKGK